MQFRGLFKEKYIYQFNLQNRATALEYYMLINRVPSNNVVFLPTMKPEV